MPSLGSLSTSGLSIPSPLSNNSRLRIWSSSGPKFIPVDSISRYIWSTAIVRPHYTNRRRSSNPLSHPAFPRVLHGKRNSFTYLHSTLAHIITLICTLKLPLLSLRHIVTRGALNYNTEHTPESLCYFLVVQCQTAPIKMSKIQNQDPLVRTDSLGRFNPIITALNLLTSKYLWIYFLCATSKIFIFAL